MSFSAAASDNSLEQLNVKRAHGKAAFFETKVCFLLMYKHIFSEATVSWTLFPTMANYITEKMRPCLQYSRKCLQDGYNETFRKIDLQYFSDSVLYYSTLLIIAWWLKNVIQGESLLLFGSLTILC